MISQITGLFVTRTCIGKQQGWIVVWDSRRGRDHSVPSVFKVLEESVPDLIERLVSVRQKVHTFLAGHFSVLMVV